MSSTAEQLLDAALALPDEDRLQLVEALDFIRNNNKVPAC
jgi:hypothetical protein